MSGLRDNDMKTIQERAREYILNANNIIELPARRYGCSVRQVSRAYIAGANEQRAIDKNDKREGEALLYTATKVTERTKKEMINKAKEAFNKACGWLSTYPWYPEVLGQFIEAMEE